LKAAIANFFAFYNLKSTIFSKPKPITVGDWNTAEPRIAGGYRTAYVVWRDEREATAQIYTKQFHLPLPNSVLVRPVPIIASCYDQHLVSCRLKYGATIAPTVWQDLSEPIKTEIDNEKIMVWDWQGQSPAPTIQGVYTLNLVAFDEAGNQSFSKIPVIIDNLPPLPISPGEITSLFDLDPEAEYRTPSFSFRRTVSLSFLILNKGAKMVTTEVRPQDLARTIPKLHSASTTACGLLRFGSFVAIVEVHSSSCSNCFPFPGILIPLLL